MHATKGRTTGEESDLSGYGRPSNDVDPGADGNGSGQRLWQRRRLHLCHQRLFQPRPVWQRWTGLLYGGGGGGGGGSGASASALGGTGGPAILLPAAAL